MTAEVLPRPVNAAERWRTGGGKDASPPSVFGGAALGSDAMLSESMESGQAGALWSPPKVRVGEGMFEHAEQHRASSLSDFYECNSEGILPMRRSPDTCCSQPPSRVPELQRALQHIHPPGRLAHLLKVPVAGQ